MYYLLPTFPRRSYTTNNSNNIAYYQAPMISTPMAGWGWWGNGSTSWLRDSRSPRPARNGPPSRQAIFDKHEEKEEEGGGEEESKRRTAHALHAHIYINIKENVKSI